VRRPRFFFARRAALLSVPRAAFCFTLRARVALVALFVFAGLLAASAAHPQAVALKTVHGTVLNKSDDPLPEAIVFLKNVQSGDVKTYIADTQGNYHFSGLDPNADYEIHAEFKGDSSPVRRISSLDGRKDIHLNLVVAHKK